MSIGSDYKKLIEAIKIARGNLGDFENTYLLPIHRYFYSLGNGILESVEIENITDTEISFTVQTSFRNEYDPPAHYTIPIDVCTSYETIKKYYDDKETAEKLLKAELERLLEEQQKSLQEENDRKTYERLRRKFEEDKGTQTNA